MALTIYGSPMSRTFRVLWLARELGLEYEHVPLDPRKGEPRAPDYLKINPNGHVPAIRDGDLILWESLAINLYLAKKHDGPLAPANAAEDGKATMWSLWAANEIEGSVTLLVQQSFGMPVDAPAAQKAKEAVRAPLGVLDAVLAASPYLLGNRFTVADLNVAGVVSGLTIAKYELAAWPKVGQWLQSCTGRKAFTDLRAAMR
jgi:glutathione S-transferase